MKNWFIKNREGIIMAILGTFACVSMVLMISIGVRDLANTHIEWEFEENVELTDEMVETYRALVLYGMRD